MENNLVEKISKNGVVVKIYQDTNYDQSPDDWEDESLFLVAFHRDFCVKRDGFDVETVRGLFDKDQIDEDNADRVKDIRKGFHVFGLEAYIHSGVALALSQEGNFVDRQWDVSQLGAVFVSKEEAKTKEKARQLARGLIETWNQYLSGDVYGYVIEATGDSCWGFYGLEHVRGDAKDALEYAWSSIQKKHTEKKRAEIRNKVPLEKRTTLQMCLA